jgi:hypothetical protein
MTQIKIRFSHIKKFKLKFHGKIILSIFNFIGALYFLKFNAA